MQDKNRRRDMKKTVKEILSNVLVLELIGLGVILTITVIILTVLYQSMQNYQSDSIKMMQQIQSIQYDNICIQNTNYKLMLSDEEEKRNKYDEEANELDMVLQKELKVLKKDFPQSDQAVGEIQKLLQQAFSYRSQAVLLAATDKKTQAITMMEEEYQPVMDEVNSQLETLSIQSAKFYCKCDWKKSEIPRRRYWKIRRI